MSKDARDYFHFIVALNEAIGPMRNSGPKLAPLLSRMATDDVLKYDLGPVFSETADPQNVRAAIQPAGYRAATGEHRTLLVPPASAAISIDVRKAVRGAILNPNFDLARVLPETLELERDILIPGRMTRGRENIVGSRLAINTAELSAAGIKIDLVNVSKGHAAVTFAWNYVAHVDGLPEAHAERFRDLPGDGNPHNNPPPRDMYENLVVAASLA